MKINLLINLYIDSNPARQAELEKVFSNNINNTLIDRIYIFINRNQYEYWGNKFTSSEKINYLIFSKRPTFNDYFGLTAILDGEINIIANSDIYFDDTLQIVKDFQWTNTICFALTRWDLTHNNNIEHLNRIDSQDCFIFYGSTRPIAYADFPLGKRGCDNRICFEFQKAGYKIVNPSKTIRSIHIHNSNIRNYSTIGSEDLIPEPYLLLQSCYLNDI